MINILLDLGKTLYEFYETSGLKSLFENVISGALSIASIVGSTVVIAISAALTVILEAITGLIDGISWIVEKMTWLAQNWSSGWSWIKEAGANFIGNIVDHISSGWQNICDTTEQMWNGIKEFLALVWEGIKLIIIGVLTAIANGIKVILTGIQNTWNAIWTGIKTFCSTLWNGIKELATTTFTAIRDKLSEMGNLEGLFDTVNAKVGEIAVQVGTTPAAWNAGVFSLIRQLSETVILPIAGLVLTFVATYELIQMLLEKNNMHEFDVANIYKWVFKTACAILILSNTFDIVMAVFDVSQSVIADAAGLIQGSTDITPDMLTELETTLEGMDLGPLLGLWLQSSVIGLTMQIMGIIIFVLVYGRMIEIYLMTSLAPLPVATLSNRELGGTGQNYLKSLFAVGFQGMLILVCVAIYAVLVQGIATGGDPIGAIWGTVGYTVLLCFMLFKTGGIAQRIFGAH